MSACQSWPFLNKFGRCSLLSHYCDYILKNRHFHRVQRAKIPQYAYFQRYGAVLNFFGKVKNFEEKSVIYQK